ncbi:MULTISPECIES: DUF3301 domain-containing protein [Methylobacter]|jgi:uncharacterized protein DUF3301|uniref:DUF3301 domain-containing protein n=1 Tax=Methylobacter TaxID=429 RepID=UPI000486C51C|nr:MULTISPECIES: DUF3301 domain-containing protein [Methylobacter]
MVFDIILIGLLIVAYLYWASAQRVKSIALNATKQHCLDMNVQMLDDYIALTGLWLKRDRTGKVHLWRSFQFEFSSTGNERYNGQIVMFGCRIESIQMEPHRLV